MSSFPFKADDVMRIMDLQASAWSYLVSRIFSKMSAVHIPQRNDGSYVLIYVLIYVLQGTN